MTYTLTQLAHKYGYNSLSRMMVDKGLLPQDILGKRGRKVTPKSIKRLSEGLGIPEEELARAFRLEHLLSLIRKAKLNTEELEAVFTLALRK